MLSNMRSGRSLGVLRLDAKEVTPRNRLYWDEIQKQFMIQKESSLKHKRNANQKAVDKCRISQKVKAITYAYAQTSQGT